MLEPNNSNQLSHFYPQFKLGGNEFSLGTNINFNGDIRYPLTDGTDLPKELLYGWACAIYTAYHGSLLMRGNQSLKNMYHIGVDAGINPESGANHVQMRKMLMDSGHETVSFSLKKSTVELQKYLGQGFLCAVNIMEMLWDEVSDPRQRGTGHWALVAGVDTYGRTLVLDSSLRPFGEGNPTYGTIVYPSDVFIRRAADFSEYMTPSETAVYPGGEWYQGHTIAFRPKNRKVLQSI